MIKLNAWCVPLITAGLTRFPSVRKSSKLYDFRRRLKSFDLAFGSVTLAISPSLK